MMWSIRFYTASGHTYTICGSEEVIMEAYREYKEKRCQDISNDKCIEIHGFFDSANREVCRMMIDVDSTIGCLVGAI